MIDEILVHLSAYAAGFMALLLIASAAHKAIEPVRLRVATEAMTGLPRGAAWVLLLLAGGLEAGAGLSMLWPGLRPLACLAAAVVWGAYLVAIIRAMSAGRLSVDCGCAFGAGRRRLSLAHVNRNLLLFVLALFTATLSTLTRVPAPAFDIHNLLAAVALFTLYVAADEIAAVKPGNRRPWAS